MDRVDLPPPPRLHLTPEDGRRALVSPDQLSGLVLRHGGLDVRWWSPQQPDPQTPHDRDELYVVVAGSGVFVRAEFGSPFAEDAPSLGAEQRVPVQSGDALFVPAGTAHRFEAVSPDFAAWSIFQGPEGGAG